MISFTNNVFKSILIIHAAAIYNVTHLCVLMILFIIFYKVFSIFYTYFSIFMMTAICFSYYVRLTLIHLNLEKFLHVNNVN